MKQRVFKTPPPDIMTLRQRILDEFQNLANDPDMIMGAVNSMQKRAQRCINRNGGHFEGHFR